MKKIKYIHKYIRVGWINEWSKKHSDKHITPVLSYSARKYKGRGSYYYAVALEWWCWAITISFISFNIKGSYFEDNAEGFKKATGRLEIFGNKIF